MGGSAYLKFLLTILTLAVLGGGFLLLRAIDRQTAVNLRLSEQLAELAARGGGGWSPAPTPTGTPTEPVGAVANREYFDPAAEPGGRLVQATAVETRNLNVLINNDAYVAEFHSLATSTLAARNYGKPEEFQPLLAESWTVSPDHRSYHIKLRRGVLYHDFTDPVTGQEHRNVEVKAQDFRFYVEVINNPEVNAAPLRVYYQDLERIEVLNDYEFVVHWKKPYYGALAATLELSPLPRHLYHAYDGPFDGRRFNDDHERNRLLIGCGPYRFVSWEKGKRVIFRRFENYFGKALGIMPPLETVAYEVYKHPNTRFQALLAGDLDLLGLTPDQWTNRLDIPQFREGKLKKYQLLSNSYSYIGYNLKNPLFQDRRVRQALTLLIDRERILKEVFYGLGVVVDGPFFPESPYCDRELKPWPCDPDRARALLAEAGWRDQDGDGVLDKDGRPFRFTMLQTSNSTIQQRMLPMIKEMLAQAGIEMQLQTVEWSVYLQRLESRNYEACNLSWTMPLDPDPFQVWHSSQAELPGSSNHVGFANAEADRLIEQLRETFDQKERIKLCHQFQALLHEEQPYTFMITPYALLGLSGRYRNVRVFPRTLPTDIIWTPRAEQLALP